MILIPGYSLIETLEENSAVLYKAQREEDHVNVLIKSCNKTDSKHRQQLEHELELTSYIDPAWGLKPIGIEQTEDVIAMIYEEFKGQTLSHFLESKTVNTKEFLKIAISICSNLLKLHERGIIHKDINPANILINPDTYEIKIIGLGIASLLPLEYSQESTNPDYIEGNLSFISPEQTGRMNRVLDYRTDMYSLGATFYLMVTGRVPFNTHDPLELIYSHLVRLPENPSDIIPFIPQQISDIILKLLAKLAEDRYQSIEGLRSDLRKCLSMLTEQGIITSFPLAEKDFTGKFRVSQKLYGREEEIRTLLECYDTMISSGVPDLVLINGYSGIGKTALVKELNKSILKEKGFYISRKFDQYNRNIPYSMVEAFKDLVGYVLSLPEESINEWKNKIHDAVGINGKIITDVIPQVELIIGKQPPLVELPPTESKNRFNLTFERFVSLFANREHPLAIFLDDMQWADNGSLELIKQLMLTSVKRYILLIGAYRTNEIDSSHPLTIAIEEMKKAYLKVKTIMLTPLKEEDIENLIKDSLSYKGEDVKDLTHLVFKKTEGNPFFTIQFLMSLYQEKLLVFDNHKMEWTWKLDDIKKKQYTDNVADFMISRIQKLNAEDQQILMIAACIGNKFNIETLSLMTGKSTEAIIHELDEPIKQGLIYSNDHLYCFLHDRIRESIYSLLEPNRRFQIHLDLGRLLYSLSHGKPEERGLFDIVNQYNLGKSLIQTNEEKKLLRDLNFTAGKKSKDATAYGSAKEYYKLSLDLIEDDSWSSDYTFIFQVYFDLSECEFLLANFDQAEELFNVLLNQAESKSDKIKVYRLRTILYQAGGTYQAAVDIAIEGLKLFSINLPDTKESIQEAIEEEIRQIPENLKGRTVKDLLQAPEATDADARLIIGLMAEMASAAYNVRSKYFNLIYLKGYNIILKYGNTEDAAYIFAFYALLRIGIFKDIPSAFDYSELSLNLNEKYQNTKLKGRLYNMNAISINYKRRHFSTGLPIFKQGFDSSLEVGDFVYASYISFTLVWHHIEIEIPLDEVLKISKKYSEFNKQKHNTTIYYVIRQYEQFVACLKGTTQGLLSFNDSTFNETEVLTIFKNSQYGPGAAIYFILKQIVSFTFQQFQEAYEFAQLAKDKLPHIRYSVTEGQYPFFYALTLSALYQTQSEEKKKEYLKEIKAQLEELKIWADNSPDNFYNRYALVKAELAGIEEKDMEAMRWYEEAINSAIKNGFLFKTAMAYELASRFYQGRGFDKIANSYLCEAYNYYSDWGAEGKCRQMEESFPFLKKHKKITTSFGIQIPQLDFLSFIKASQIISSEMDSKKLIENLMNIVIEQAGAEKAFLLLIKEEQLWLISEAITTNNKLQIRNHLEEAIYNPTNLPDSILQYVKRVKEKTIINDASATNLFSNDPYILTNRPRSIACLPILKQGNLFGILYFENNLFTSAFSQDKIVPLELLASQAAIAIENSLLFTELANSKQLMQDMMNNSSASIFIKDLHGKYLYINNAYQEVMKVSEPEVIGKTTYDLWQKDTADQLTAHDMKVLETGKPINFEETGLMMNGTLQTKISVRFPVYDMHGKIYAIGGISTDISDRKRAEEALHERESRIRRLVESNIIGIYFWDEGGVITETNDAFAQLIGYASDEINSANLNWKKLSDEKYTHAINKADEELKQKGANQPFETEFIRKDHSKVPVLVAGTLLQKRIDKGIGFVLNLTDLKKAEEEIRRLNIGLQDRIKELTLSKQELERVNLDLLKTNTDLDNFIYAASHNVRGPASSLEGLINVLDLKLYKPEELDQIVSMMKLLMNTFNQTINDLTEISKVQRIIENKDIIENAIDQVVDEIKEEIKVTIETSGTSFITDFHSAPTLRYSYNNLRRILYNLIINSITYSSPLRKPVIVIKSTQNQEYVIITVTDNGLGIQPKYFEKIFEMFKRAHDHIEGRGIGLYIVKRIMENSNGKVEVTSEVNKGSTFTLYFKK